MKRSRKKIDPVYGRNGSISGRWSLLSGLMSRYHRAWKYSISTTTWSSVIWLECATRKPAAGFQDAGGANRFAQVETEWRRAVVRRFLTINLETLSTDPGELWRHHIGVDPTWENKLVLIKTASLQVKASWIAGGNSYPNDFNTATREMIIAVTSKTLQSHQIYIEWYKVGKLGSKTPPPLTHRAFWKPSLFILTTLISIIFIKNEAIYIKLLVVELLYNSFHRYLDYFFFLRFPPVATE